MHSYLDDGPAMQFSHYGGYLGWAALELYAVEDLIGARLAHCYGGLVPDPAHRAIVGLALDDLRDGDSLGSMVYGNTVEYGRDRQRNLEVLSTSVMTDIATQLHRPTGHAINPVPLSEAERIPDAAEVLEVQLIARELEREVRARRRAAGLGVGRAARRRGGRVRARVPRRRARPPARRRRRRRPTPPSCCWRCAAARPRSSRRACASTPRASCARWRPGSTASSRASPNARGARCRGSTACASCSPRSRSTTSSATRSRASCRAPAAQVIVLPSSVSPAQVARVAADEDAQVVVVATYNGGALTLGRELTAALDPDIAVIFGGVLNEDDGGPLPVDARPGLEALGIDCVDDIEQLGGLLTSRTRG